VEAQGIHHRGIICGLQVVRLTAGPSIGQPQFVRALSCFLSLAVVGLGFLWIASTAKDSRGTDKIAGTAVVRAPKVHRCYERSTGRANIARAMPRLPRTNNAISSMAPPPPPPLDGAATVRSAVPDADPLALLQANV